MLGWRGVEGCGMGLFCNIRDSGATVVSSVTTILKISLVKPAMPFNKNHKKTGPEPLFYYLSL
jgi:hypothetical protein